MMFDLDMPCDDTMLERSIQRAPDGLLMEFGVFAGASLRRLCKATPRTVYGFDSFKGLPENWRPGMGKGYFACDGPPRDLPANARIVEGLIQRTLPTFLQQHRELVAYAHIDVDVYSSAKSILAMIAPRLQRSAVLLFDEIVDAPGNWPVEMQGRYNADHEARAFNEFVHETGYQFEVIGRRHLEAYAMVRVK